MPQKITDEEGNIAWNAQYKARGEAKEITSKKAAQGAGFKNPLKLQGQYVDLSIDGANRHDMKQVKNIHWTTSWLPVRRRRQVLPQRLCLDKGYDFDEARDIVKAFGLTARIRARGEETRAIKQEAGFKARRWVVERTHSWMNRFRRILARWERLPRTFIAMPRLARGIITWRTTGLMK